MPLATIARRLSAPILILILAAFTWTHSVEQNTLLGDMPGIGPEAWPRFMIGTLIFCALLWLAREIVMLVRPPQSNGGETVEEAIEEATESDEPYSYPKAMFGLALIIVYGALLRQIGFPLATFLFIVAWCLLGGVRRPLVVLPVSVIGTIVLVYVFVGLATMPLERGFGVFDVFTIALYRLLGIY